MTREQIIASGVRTLKQDYPCITSENIMTDMVYRAFFKSNLELTIDELQHPNNSGRISKNQLNEITNLCQSLIDEISKTQAAEEVEKVRHKNKKSKGKK